VKQNAIRVLLGQTRPCAHPAVEFLSTARDLVVSEGLLGRPPTTAGRDLLSKRWSAARINSRLTCKLEVNCCNQAITLIEAALAGGQ
jgi:hypothetical protein